MGKLVITTNTSLDGVVQDPDGQEGFRARRLVRTVWGQGPRRVGRIMLEEALRTDALLLGRRAKRGSGRVGRSGWRWADRLNSLPKYVVSSNLEAPQWTNVTVLKGDVVDEVTRLKRELHGEIARLRELSARTHADGVRPRRRVAALRLPGGARSRGALLRRHEPKRSRCASSTVGPSATA